MKFNVDLTENRDFRPNDWSIKWIENGVEKEELNPNNPDACQYLYDFFKGKIIFFTGNATLRKTVITRMRENQEICDECGKKIRIPWRDCKCYENYLAKYHKIPWRNYFASRYGREIPWRIKYFTDRRIPWM